MGRTVADTRLLFAAQVGMDDREPLAFPLRPDEIRARARPISAGCASPGPRISANARSAAEIREVMRARIGAMRHLFRTCDEVGFDFGEADRCFDIVRAQNFVARYQAAYAKDPASLGPNVRANYEVGAGMSLADAAWAHAEQTRIFRRFQANFRDYDLVLSPTTPVSPFPWTQLYLAEIEGRKLANYYHWLALTYYITLVTNPAISLPCGVDHNGMPFGLQVDGPLPRRRGAVGRRRGDGAGVRRDRQPAPAAAGYRQARRHAPSRAQIHRHPPAGADVTVSANVSG